MSLARRDSGFTYLMVLFFIAALAAGLAVVGGLWATSRQREREVDLLFAGSAIRQAIGAYYLATPGPVKQYPPALENLLKDARFPDTRRYLRQIYPDPMTGTTEWALIKAPQGGIMGVASASESAPIKRAGFREPNQAFDGLAPRLKDKLRYRDWEFIYEPGRRPVGTQGAGVRGF